MIPEFVRSKRVKVKMTKTRLEGNTVGIRVLGIDKGEAVKSVFVADMGEMVRSKQLR